MKINRLKFKENMTGYLFVLPNLIGIFVLILFSLAFSLAISFSNWNLIGDLKNVKWIGWDNYRGLVDDELFWQALFNNLWFLLIIPVQTFLSLLLAVLLNNAVFGNKPLRVIYFLPNITNAAAILVVWNLLLNPDKGPINGFLGMLGVKDPPLWLFDPAWAKPAVALFGVWGSIGFYALLYLAALQAVPKDLYEAAELDGANRFRKFVKITLPLISPTTFFTIILSVIGSFKSWSSVQILTRGGPGNSTYVLGLYVYDMGFPYMKMGYASAIAWILFIIILLFTGIQWWVQKKWVHYN